MKTAIISEKGAIVIPKEIREARGLYPGTRVQIVTYGDVTAIVPVPENPVAALDGMFAGDDADWTAILLQERQTDAEHETDKIQQQQKPTPLEHEIEA
ncbi:MAG: AbrB/MazE/SpoVT family DNA-binding domain-containing protein [Anaerolineae bacterium]|jgi:AbrB family looped-hinge helix DNA binding protein|nr:AbrB/MazE/SpoVT family DNA-binding domain-containing protein [Anaerolineae bacterium]